jgi:hypothetical protein
MIVLPCSTAGTFTPLVREKLSRYRIPASPERGLSLGDLRVHPFVGGENIAQFVAFATSVKSNSSSPEAMSVGTYLGSGSLLVKAVWRVFGDPSGWAVGCVPFTHHFMGMKQNSLTLPFANVRLTSVALIESVWVVWAAKIGTAAACPRCQVYSSARHSSYQRRF